MVAQRTGVAAVEKSGSAAGREAPHGTVTNLAVACKYKRCGRVLKDPAYIKIGFGRVCAEQLGIQTSEPLRINKHVNLRRANENGNQLRLSDMDGELDETEMV